MRPTRENASRSLIRSCIRRAPSTAKPMYWSARASSSPAVALLQQLAEGGDLAQRLLEIVRGDVGELLELGVGAPQVGLGVAQGGELRDDPCAHGLDVLAEVDHLARARAGHGVFEVSARHRAHAGGEPLERVHDRATQHERHRGDAQQHDDPRPEHPEEHDVGVAVEPIAGVLAGRDQQRLQAVDRSCGTRRSAPCRRAPTRRCARSVDHGARARGSARRTPAASAAQRRSRLRSAAAAR